MREIKFRAWYNDVKKMRYFYLYDYEIIEQIYLHNNSEEMEYTGLNDKNGKEIYEGDIVKAKRKVHNWETYEDKNTIRECVNYITYCEDRFGVMGYACDGLKTWDEIEVIGNIYENPELLEDKKNE
jgi:uncharacterized phage protein (TIGR01671 family)